MAMETGLSDRPSALAAEGGSTVLHVCCAPCLATAQASLRAGNDRVRAEDIWRVVFYNPNIHPLLEFRRRVKALQVYLERDPLPAEIDDRYGLHEYLGRVVEVWRGGDRRDRCYQCYLMRLEKTAGIAAAGGCGRFTSTLLASREQDRDLVAGAGREAGRKHGVEFVETDLRKYLPDEKMLRGIYKQQYCGCIFSEEERFRGTKKHLYFPGGDRPDGEDREADVCENS